MEYIFPENKSVEISDKRRKESLIETVNVGVCACQGYRSTMEDVYRLILWSGIKHYDTHEKNDEDGSEKPPKRQKRNSETLTTQLTEENNISKSTSFPEKEIPVAQNVEIHKLEKVSFFIVCDGHGGVQAANYVNIHLFNNIISQSCFESDPEKAIVEGFSSTERAYEEYARKEDLDGMVGTTVTAILIIGNILYAANVGDSDAVICRKGKEFILTESHIPSNPSEKKRIELEGGSIVIDRKGTKRLAHPTWNPIFVNIGVTRAIGDFYFKNYEYVGEKKSGLIATPSVAKWNLTVDDEFMIMASDGFWDVVSPKEAINFVSSKIYLDCNSICKELMELSKNRNSKDNITILLVKFTVPSISESDVRLIKV